MIEGRPLFFIVKKPGKTRRTFQIVPYQRDDAGKRTWVKGFKNEALDALNRRYKAKELGYEECVTLIDNTILPAIRKKSKIPEKLATQKIISDENHKVFSDFWRDKYRRAKLESPETVKAQLLRALRLLEPLSLITSDIHEIQDQWDKKLSGTPHKRYGGRINQMLDYLKRGIYLNLDKVPKKPPIWITFSELETILKKIDDDVLKDLYRTLWGTGCRLGEIFPLESEDLKINDTLFISRQISFKKELKSHTKNRVSHFTMVLPEARDAVLRWLAVKDKLQYRQRCSHPLIYASRETFPGNPQKRISPHKLRHSYVRYLLDRGVSIDKIKDLIGDTLKTTEETYGGWVISNSQIDSIKDTIMAANAKIKKV